MKNLLYISYGSGPHDQEIIFSALSACRWSLPGRDYRVLVLTDHPEAFSGLPVEVEAISTQQWTLWAGPSGFGHRCKILALDHVIRSSGEPTILLDADTWLRASPCRLFERLEPGRTLMHIREGRIDQIESSLFRELRELLDSTTFQNELGDRFEIPTTSTIFNAGVIGIAPADVAVLSRVLDLTDQLCRSSNLHILEQLAFSYILSTETSLQEADDLVFHYWPPYLHAPFSEKIGRLMQQARNMPLDQRTEFLYANRPRPTWTRRGKVIAKRIFQATGIIRGRIRSNEW